MHLMEPDPDTSRTITFTLTGEALTELDTSAEVEGRTREMQAKILVLKALGKYADYTPQKKPSASPKPVAKKATRPSRPPTAMGGLS